MSDFETALEHKDHMQSGEAHELRQEGFRRQDKRIAERAELTKDEQAETSNLLTALLVTGDTKYAARLQELNERVDLHSSATIEALLENQERLDAIEQRMDHMLSEAYVLPDGRRVFKSEDGVRVEDEFGAVVSASEVDPDSIEDYRPSLETWEAAYEQKQALNDERAELIEYQNKLDQAQTLIDQGGLSADDFDDLDNLMTSDVPDAVRARLPSSDPAFRAAQTPTSNLDDGFDFSDLDLPSQTSRMTFK
ncbi:hypothetical protein [uncultured Roseobacter sp.]|uniref:hypothetical protein n=1 Tax=uncultured Roseobacter sp. TaxID=114847 RepID=UPI00261A93EA|nr:hypothetical protein [uncultured Roseobacter sp.]